MQINKESIFVLKAPRTKNNQSKSIERIMSEKYETSCEETLKLLISDNCSLNLIQFVLELFIPLVLESFQQIVNVGFARNVRVYGDIG